ncbi:protein-export chaperone SecB [Azospirillum picis]|uniref:Protein-export protein SecB n=1 Tax=Azospirillum picis TaxID=488438 RepID=A0ABU0ML25_9PROT|nr:protein-export chaperone SecB [Azospirillum picis]MBP2300377.1 preprotein translocase subunit SecB [Azospirillum picis]MDQ0534173.1 preprotein translocase subunit SecB [Azospirillum picis]
MSDQMSNGAEQQASSLPMHVLAQYVKDLSFENPNAPQSLLPNQPQPQVNIGVDVQGQKVGDDIYELTLNLRCEARQGEAVAFIVELAYGALFQFPGLPEEHHRPVLMIEGARMIFPFARAIVSSATREGGFPPLMINPIDFAELYHRQSAPQGQQPANSQPPF